MDGVMLPVGVALAVRVRDDVALIVAVRVVVPV